MAKPTTGGSYTRQKNGELKLVQRTEEPKPGADPKPDDAAAADQTQQKGA